MKQIFRCEYCDKLGTEEELITHEDECIYNYTKKSCFTCKYRKAGIKSYEFTCMRRSELPKGCFASYCPDYMWDEKVRSVPFNDLFGGLFGRP